MFSLHPLSGENLRYRSAIQDDDVRVDVRASSFWLLEVPKPPYLL